MISPRFSAASPAIERWMADFDAIARLALTSSPQQLEILGIPVASN